MDTNKVGCFIVKLSSDRYELFKDEFEWRGEFSEPVSDFKHSRNLPLICFVVNDKEQITHIGKGKKGQTAGTNLKRLKILEAEKLSEPFSLEKILKNIPRTVQRHVSNRINDGGVLPPKTSESFIDTILELYPKTEKLLARFGKSYHLRLERLSDNERFSLATQKEAIATAMAISNIDREELQKWVLTSDEKPESFLDGLDETRLREDQMLATDWSTVPGYKHIKNTKYGAAIFRGSSGEKLTVVLANRLPLEQLTGTDLIYYNEDFHAFVMVQYKAMEKEDKETVFRLPNKQLNDEISRMEAIIKELKKCPQETHHNGFRFNDNPFFLKFCPRLQFSPNDQELIKGMYIHLDHWALLKNASELYGPHGGKKLTYKNAGRYLNNTSFITLVSQAWVGTTQFQSKILDDAINNTLESGRAITIAVKNASADGDKVKIEDNYPED